LTRKILKLIKGKQDVSVWTPVNQLRIGSNGWFSEDVNEASGSSMRA
jgi:hypothetical protein